MTKPILTQARLKELLHYDPATGLFTWLVRTARCVQIGDIAGSLDLERYSRISVDKFRYKSHKLAWLYCYGELSDLPLDHINGVRDDNRIVNLRPATTKQNLENRKQQTNNTSGFRGVGFHKGKWRAGITHNQKWMHLGLYDTPEEAGAVAKAKRDELFTHHHTTHSA